MLTCVAGFISLAAQSDVRMAGINVGKVVSIDTESSHPNVEVATLELFRTHVYGRSPGRPEGLRCAVTSEDTQALGGLATRKEVAVFFNGKEDGPRMERALDAEEIDTTELEVDEVVERIERLVRERQPA